MPDLTELVDIDPSRVDLVKNPANGFPILIMKALSDPVESAPQPTPAVASDTDAIKETGVPETKTEETSPAPEAPEVKAEPETVEKSAAELVQEEVAKAVQPLNEVIKGLRDEMAVLKSTPIPGGPVVTVPGSQRNDSQRAQALAEAQRFDKLAKDISGNAELARYYEERAAEERAKAAQA